MRLSNFHINLGKLIAVITLLLIGGQAWGATYYVCQSAAGSGDGSSAANCDDIAGFNGGAFGALDGDTVYFLGAITTQITVPDGGANEAARVFIRGDYPGNACTITTADAYGVSVASRDYITVTGFTCAGAATACFYNDTATGLVLSNLDGTGCPLVFRVGTCSGATLSNLTGAGTSATSSFIRILGTSTSVIISNVSSTSTAGYGIYPTGCTNISISDATFVSPGRNGILLTALASGVFSLSNVSVTGVSTAGFSGIRIIGDGVNAITFSGNNITSNSSANHGLEINPACPITSFSLTNYEFDSNGVSGVSIAGGNDFVFDTGSASGNTLDGFNISATTGANILKNTTISSNGRDGVGLTLNATNWSISENMIALNGQTDASGYGDGITAHSGCTGINAISNVLTANKNSGFALTVDSAGTLSNNTILFNGLVGTTNMGVRGGLYSDSSGAFVVSNNLFEGNYPQEIAITATQKEASTFDYNSYYHVGNGVTEAEAFNLTLGGTNTLLNWTDYLTAAAGFSAGDEANSKYASTCINVDYTLPAGHAAIGSGVLITGLHDQASPAKDFAGTDVTWGPSIGAYQPTPANVIYFDKSAAAGGNGTQSAPYDAMEDYPVAKLISGTAAKPLYIYLKGDFSAEALDFSAYGGPADPYVIIRTPRLNQAANLGALTVKGSNMTQQYYQQQQGLPGKIWDSYTQYTTVP